MIAALRRAATWAETARRRLRAPFDRDESGFALLEAMVAITLITIITAALGTFFVSSMASSKQQRAKEIASHLADGSLDTLRSYPASDLTSGRGYQAVQTQFNNAPSQVQTWLSALTPAYDSSLGLSSTAGATATIPTASFTKSPDNVTTFTLNEYLGTCGIPKSSPSTTCDNKYLDTTQYAASTVVTYYEAVVAISWPNATCSNSTCYYVTSTLVTADTDPTFNLNETGSAAPIVVSPGNQDNQIGDTVNLQLSVQASTGVPSYTWSVSAGSLPAGLSLSSSSGLISGSPTTAVNSQSVTVTVTDGFGRTASSTFTWTVVPKLVASSVATMYSTTGTAITNFTISASGGSGGPYTFTDSSSTLPPGVTIGSSTGTVSGTPTATGTYSVKITVKDATTHSVTVSWSWTVYAPVVLTNPGTQANVVSTAITPLQISATGGSGSYTWSVGGTVPAGLTFASGKFTGTPTTKTSYSTTVYVTDTVLNTTKSVTFTWNVVAPIVITGGSDQLANVGNSTTAVTLSASGGDTGSTVTYAWSDPNGTLPPGVSVTTDSSYRGVISGTPTTAGTYAVQLKVTASTGAVSWLGFNWTVYPSLVLTSPGNQTSTVNTTITPLQVSASGGSGSYSFSGTLPTGLAVSSSGLITGKPTATGTTTASITLTDTVTSYTKTISFSWYVAPAPTVTAPANQFATTTGSVSGVSVGGSCLNTPCTYTLNNGPAGLSVSSTGVISGTITSAAQTFNSVTVTVKDAAGVTATSSNFTWTVNAKPTITTPASQTTYVNRAATNVTVSASGGTTAYTYAASGLPSGLSINASTGVISGTASSSTSSNSVTVTVTDASGVTATTSSFSWNVTDLILAVPDQQVGTSASLSVPLNNFELGGSGANTYNVTGMPGWMSYSTSTKTITGTSPSTESATTITVTATDAAGASVTDTFIVYVSKTRFLFSDQQASLSSTVSVDLDNYVSGTSFSSFTVTGLPSWLSYNTSTHVISSAATPAANTVASGISIKVTETTGFTFTRTIKWIASDLRWNGTSTTWSTVHGVAMSKNLSGFFTGGTGAYTYQTSSTLPTGTSLNMGTGVVSGTPTVTGTKSVVFTVTDNVGATASITVTWTVT